MKTAVIIDDEKIARDYIESFLELYFPDIKIDTKASSVKNGIEAIINNKPDIVFLDIDIQDGTGFDVLDALPERNFDLIFTTGHDQYAIKAFKYSAIDYLVKPIDIKDFINSIERILKSNTTKKSDNYNILKENINSKTLSKLAVPTRLGYEYINISDIIRFEADGRYSQIYLINEKKITVSKALGEFNDLISLNNFFKTHKSHIINLTYVKKFVKQDGGYIIMEDDSQIAIARNKREEFIEIMNNLSE